MPFDSFPFRFNATVMAVMLPQQQLRWMPSPIDFTVLRDTINELECFSEMWKMSVVYRDCDFFAAFYFFSNCLIAWFVLELDLIFAKTTFSPATFFSFSPFRLFHSSSDTHSSMNLKLSWPFSPDLFRLLCIASITLIRIQHGVLEKIVFAIYFNTQLNVYNGRIMMVWVRNSPTVQLCSDFVSCNWARSLFLNFPFE